ncbi:MAG: hypothetical protein HY721_10610 [Planctomycetes bacterium]|nr:hypothetical protein [Planctomycetota bacterium]
MPEAARAARTVSRLSARARRRSAVLSETALLAVSAPAFWTALAWTERGQPFGLAEGPIFLAAAAAASVLLLLAALLALRGARGALPLALLAWSGWAVPLSARAARSPALVFLCGAWAALVTYLLIFRPRASRVVRFRPGEDPGAVLSPAVLTSGPVALLLAGFAAGHALHATPVGRWAVPGLLLVPALVATAAEWLLVRAGRLEAWTAGLLSAATALGLALLAAPGAACLVLAARVALAIAGAARAHELHGEVVAFLWRRPAALVVLTFAALALAGGIVLKFPGCTTRPIAAVDALFTAVSACCVTGLVVLETPTDFSFAGQAVILGLVQVGGLGIMTLSAFATLLVGGGLPSEEEQGLADIVGSSTPARTVRLLRAIVLWTLVIEGAGALLLLPAFLLEGVPPLGALWKAAFHAVSAFCNAGFALQADSLVAYQRSPWILHVIGGLIVAGGLGFGVLTGLADLAARRARRVPLHSRIVVSTTGVLLAGGLALFLLLEWNRSLAGLGLADKLHNAWLQSVTTRTAGFHSVDFAGIAPATALVAMLLMFIGASPASTGGGTKTATAAVLFLSVRAVLKQSSHVQAFGRRIPASAVFRAAAVAGVSAALVAAGTALLLATQAQPFESLLFEAVSAFGTVGLSLGATQRLDPVGKLIVMGLMFAGRTGPLTLMLLFHHRGEDRLRYPEEEVLIG